MRNDFTLLVTRSILETGFVRENLIPAFADNQVVIVEYRDGQFHPSISDATSGLSDRNAAFTAVFLCPELNLPEKQAIVTKLKSEKCTGKSPIISLAFAATELEAPGDSRIKIENALRDSEEKYRNLIENLPVGIVITSFDGHPIQRNKAAREMHGYTSKEEFSQIPISSLYVDLTDRKRLLEAIARGTVRNFEVRHRRKDGSVFWISITGIPQIDETGEKQLVTVSQDITERKEAEEALRASEEKFRTLLENAPVGITVTTPEGRRLEANRAIVEMHGYRSREEYLKATTQDTYYRPEDRERVMSLLEKGPIKNLELQRKRKDGSVFWASLSSIPYVVATGETRIINVVEDITERKHAEEALKASEERYRSLFENAPIGITISLPNGTSIQRNAAAQQMHGYATREEFMNVNVGDLYFNPADRKRFVELAAKGPVRDFEVRHKRKDGTPFWVSQTSIPIKSADGQTQFIVIVRDITGRRLAEEAIKASEEKFRNLVENAPAGISITTPDGRRLEANNALVRMHGYDSKEEFLKVPSAERYLDPDDRERLLALVERGTVRNFETRLKKKDGTVFWGSITMMPQTTARGEKQYIVVTLDITERKQAEEALRLSEEKFRNIFNFSGDAVFIHGISGGYIEVNRTAGETFGYNHEELLKMSPADLESTEFAGMASERMRELIDRGQVSFETVYIAKEGRPIPVEIRSTLINYDGKPAVLNAVRDISERKKMEEAVRQLAYHDSLTGLPNRALFSDRISIALARARRYGQKLALAVIDLDHFKNINDTMGHEAGDELLKAVASRLNGLLRRSDTVARFGGDEFIVLFSDVMLKECISRMGKRIMEIFQSPFVIAGKEVAVKASIGLALYPDHGEDIDTLVKHADDAMYTVKVKGRNNFTLYTAGTGNQMGKR